MKLVTRTEAQQDGLTRYFTGKPCLRGHIAERMTSNKMCTECKLAREAAYRAENKEKLSDACKRYAAENPEKIKAYYQNNKDSFKARSDRRYAEKRDEILSRQRHFAAENPDRAALKGKKYRLNHPEKVREVQQANYRKNKTHILSKQSARHSAAPEKSAAKVALRRARKVRAIPAWFSEFDAFVWLEAADLVRKRRIETGIDWAADHMIALSGRTVSGFHVAENCQVIPAVMNLEKSNKYILTERLEWLK